MLNTIKFWTKINGPVRLSLSEGNKISHSQSWHNGEGWSWRAVQYELRGDTITARHGWGGTDCDGSSGGGLDLTSLACSHPVWEAKDEWSRDHTAEREGY